MDPYAVENEMIKFLEGLRVKDKKTNELVRPKGSYFEFNKSMLKTSLIKLTGFDFNNTTMFSKLEQAINAIRGRIKAAGRAELDHFPEIPSETLNAIFGLCKNLENLLEARKDKNEVAYEEALKKIPHEFRNKYHELARINVQFLVGLFDCRRGVEGIQDLRKEHFEKRTRGDFMFFQKVIFLCSTFVEIEFYF